MITLMKVYNKHKVLEIWDVIASLNENRIGVAGAPPP